jgi:hypothetical protein
MSSRTAGLILAAILVALFVLHFSGIMPLHTY